MAISQKRNWKVAKASIAVAIGATLVSMTLVSAAPAFAAESLLRIATMHETTGIARTGALVRMPVVLDDNETLDPAHVRVTRDGSNVTLPSEVTNTRVVAGRITAANVYVVDDVAANATVQYDIYTGGTAPSLTDMAVDDNTDAVTVHGDDLDVTVSRTGAHPGTITGLSTDSVNVGVSGGFGPTASVRVEELLNDAMNADVENGTTSPAGWTSSASSNDAVVSWSQNAWQNGSHSLEIDTTGVPAPPDDGIGTYVDFTSPDYHETGTWIASGAVPGYRQPGTRYSRTVGATASWSAPGIDPGDYDVYAWIPATTASAPDNTPAASYTVTTDAGDATPVVFDQRVDWGSFVKLGTWSLDSTAKVTLTGTDTTITRADTVLLQPAGVPIGAKPTYVDSASDTYHETGVWTPSGAVPGYVQPETRYTKAVGATASWSAPDIDPGDYDVYVWIPDSHTSAPNNTPAASYSVTAVSGVSSPILLDQRANNGTFQKLGTWTLDATAKVTLTGTDTAITRADTVLFEPAGLPIGAGSSDQAYGRWTSDPQNVTAGDRLYLQIWGKAMELSAQGQAVAKVNFTTTAGAPVGQSQIFAYTARTWTQVTRTITVPATATRFTVAYDVVGSGHAYFDDLTVYRSTTTVGPMSGTSATQRNVSVDAEPGLLETTVHIVNQLMIGGTPQQAYQLIDYRIPKTGAAIQQTVQYRGTPDVVKTSHSVEATNRQLIAGGLSLGSNGTTGDASVQVSSAFDPSTGAIDHTTAVVDSGSMASLVLSGSSVEAVTSASVGASGITVTGPTRVDSGPSFFYLRLLRENRTQMTFSLLHSVDVNDLHDRYLTDANELVAAVDDPNRTMDSSLAPLIRQANDLILNGSDPRLQANAWTGRALAAYVNEEITGDSAYATQAAAIVAQGLQPGLLTVDHWRTYFDDNSPIIDSSLRVLPLLYYYDPDPRIPQLADAIGQAAMEKLGFVDLHGNDAMAASENAFGALSASDSVINMELYGGAIYAWGARLEGDTSLSDWLESVFNGPNYNRWVGSGEIAYTGLAHGDYIPVQGDGVVHYSAISSQEMSLVEWGSDGAISFDPKGKYAIFSTVTIDQNELGDDASGWPQPDLLQPYAHRMGYGAYNAYAMAAAMYGGDGVEGVTQATRFLTRYVDLIGEVRTDDSDVQLLPNIIDPDFGQVMGEHVYDLNATEYHPGVAGEIAITMSTAYVLYHHPDPTMVPGSFRSTPGGSSASVK